MPRNDSLKQLKIMSYGGTKFPNWIGDPSFIRLKHVTIHGCKNCVSLPPLGQLPSLKELFIEGMDGVKYVGLELLGTTGVAFPSLEILSIIGMLGWEKWSTKSGSVDIVFPCLQELRINQCPDLVQISLEALPSLRVLRMKKCGYGLLRNLVRAALSVTKLEIEFIYGLTYEVWRGVIVYLGAVEELYIITCDEMRYLWESEAEASKTLASLRKMELHRCKSLLSLGEKEEDCGSNLLTSFRMLDIHECENFQRCSCPSSIELLSISYCGSVTFTSFPTGTGTEEQKIMLLKTYRRWPKLEYVYIRLWPHLKSIIELNYFVHLTQLTILRCHNLESFPDFQLPNLTSLQHMIISHCTSMNVLFPRGYWPPKLCSLRIGCLKKPISEWGPQNFPTSLVELTLYGEPADKEDVSSCSQLSSLLPSSLTSLILNDFDKLESSSTGVQHLTSLQHLHINKCPKMKDLPEMLLPPLLSLNIFECPYLKQRSNRRDSYYWPLISHIPSIFIP